MFWKAIVLAVWVVFYGFWEGARDRRKLNLIYDEKHDRYIPDDRMERFENFILLIRWPVAGLVILSGFMIVGII